MRDWREIVGETSRVTDPLKRKELVDELEHALEERDKLWGIAHEATPIKIGTAVFAEALAATVAARKNGADFLMTDLEKGLSFGWIALQSQDEQKRKRNASRARDAYETVSRFRDRLDLSDAEAKQINCKLEDLKNVLQQLDQAP